MKQAADPRETKFCFEPKTRTTTPLSSDQVNELLNAPDISTARGIRNVAIIATIAYTGLRETEVGQLQVDNLCLTGGEGETGINVPEGPASTKRFVPFYTDFPLQKILEAWLTKTGINEGPVFRGFFRNERRLRDNPITLQAIEDIFRLYPINDDQPIHVKPFDLRVFYARMLYALDFSLDVISQNLGIQTQTAANYIGIPSKDTEMIPAFDITKLQGISNTFVGNSLVEG